MFEHLMHHHVLTKAGMGHRLKSCIELCMGHVPVVLGLVNSYNSTFIDPGMGNGFPVNMTHTMHKYPVVIRAEEVTPGGLIAQALHDVSIPCVTVNA
jgi:hypothetical protein